jgi:hypothetical protein
MEKSESIGKLATAVICAQQELKVISKSADNPFFHSKYADLVSVWNEYKRVFPKHGLAVLQSIEGMGLRTTLIHESGEFVSSVAALVMVKNDPQGQMSAVTYNRRYGLMAICNMVAEEEDDDGNAATHPAPAKAPSKPQEAQNMGHAGSSEIRGFTGIVESSTKGEGKKPWEVKIDGRVFKTFDNNLGELLASLKGKQAVVHYKHQVSGKFENDMIVNVQDEPGVPF